VIDPHALAEARSLAFHAEVAVRILADPTIVEMARARVRQWLSTHPEPAYARAWAELVEGPIEALTTALRDDGERARALRQSSPFAGAIDPRTRWRIHAEVRERLEAVR
jgi:hypothetical protein